jgi:outer membrane protein
MIMSETSGQPDRKWIMIVGVVALLSLAGGAYAVVRLHTATPVRIGYIRSEALLAQYKPVIAIQKKLQEETVGVQQDLEKRYKELEAMDAEIKKKSEVLTMQALAPQIQRLQSKQNEFLQLQQNVQAQVGEKQAQLMEPILQDINTFVTKYGKDNGYTMIFGMPIQGMIVYGDPAEDLTDVIAAELNARVPVSVPVPYNTGTDTTK